MPNLLFPLFTTGMILGFSIAAPVGPIGVLCMRRTLAEGRHYGFISGLGAAAADAVYGAIAAFGLTLISSVLIDQQGWLRLIGGLFLCYLGMRTFFSKVSEQAADVKRGSLWAAFGSTFFLTLTNPMTILSFAAIFAGFDVAGKHFWSPASSLDLQSGGCRSAPASASCAKRFHRACWFGSTACRVLLSPFLVYWHYFSVLNFKASIS
jgi:threonine/homoserine/homoserine lactone efflux protein